MVTKKKRKTTKRKTRIVYRERPMDSAERSLDRTTQMVGNVMIAGMGLGLAGAIIGSINK